MKKTCPKCVADCNWKPAPKELRFWCGSSASEDGDFYQSGECVRRERDNLLERVKRLEAWGDRLEELLGDPPDANCSCHISPPCNDCVEWAAIREAKTEWNQAKETKP